jgi:hypothetical protein
MEKLDAFVHELNVMPRPAPSIQPDTRLREQWIDGALQLADHRPDPATLDPPLPNTRVPNWPLPYASSGRIAQASDCHPATDDAEHDRPDAVRDIHHTIPAHRSPCHALMKRFASPVGGKSEYGPGYAGFVLTAGWHFESDIARAIAPVVAFHGILPLGAAIATTFSRAIGCAAFAGADAIKFQLRIFARDGDDSGLGESVAHGECQDR